jgi:uncharacterized protein YigA (DUF484 family)
MDGSQGAIEEDPSNVVHFGPVAIARVHAAHQREATQRRELEELARANFAAQAQTHGAVIDLLDATGLSDLAARVDEIARERFGLSAGVLALECESAAPGGWRRLVDGQIDMLIGGAGNESLMGFVPTALGLFGDRQGDVASMAMVRLEIWEPARAGLICFGSADPEGFTPDMGPELVAFLARVVERTAGRWRPK